MNTDISNGIQNESLISYTIGSLSNNSIKKEYNSYFYDKQCYNFMATNNCFKYGIYFLDSKHEFIFDPKLNENDKMYFNKLWSIPQLWHAFVMQKN